MIKYSKIIIINYKLTLHSNCMDHLGKKKEDGPVNPFNQFSLASSDSLLILP
ncbi:hypothetical protein HanIR_Chr16g0791081 [Helianthus annuus]|nr:hypothetical protein HanIR_Chr16g0791081 [Helianthus annuus]